MAGGWAVTTRLQHCQQSSPLFFLDSAARGPYSCQNIKPPRSITNTDALIEEHENAILFPEQEFRQILEPSPPTVHLADGSPVRPLIA